MVQLYVGYPHAAGEPPQQTRGFVKRHLQPAESVNVAFDFPSSERDVSVWDDAKRAWVKVAGTYTVSVGLSSRDPLALKGTMVVV